MQEAKLKQWQSPQRPSSTLDNFASASGYGSFAADAMARVRARLAGFEDDDTLTTQQQPGASEEQQQAAAGVAQQQQGRCSLHGGTKRSLQDAVGCPVCMHTSGWLFQALADDPGRLLVAGRGKIPA